MGNSVLRLAAWSVLVPDAPAFLSGRRMGIDLSILAYKAIGNVDTCAALYTGDQRLFVAQIKKWVTRILLWGVCPVIVFDSVSDPVFARMDVGKRDSARTGFDDDAAARAEATAAPKSIGEGTSGGDGGMASRENGTAVFVVKPGEVKTRRRAAGSFEGEESRPTWCAATRTHPENLEESATYCSRNFWRRFARTPTHLRNLSRLSASCRARCGTRASPLFPHPQGHHSVFSGRGTAHL